MKDVLIALHFQNDICHPQGKIPFALNRNTESARHFLEASRRVLAAARRERWTIAHKHIGFADDYSDLPCNCRLFEKTAALGAVKRDSWGAASYVGFEPHNGEIFVVGTGNSAFRRTGLESALRQRGIERINIIGLATQFSVEHTARDAADMGYAVRLVTDCCMSADAEAHRASLRTLAMLADTIDSEAIFSD